MSDNRYENMKKLAFQKLEDADNGGHKNGWYHVSGVAVLCGVIAMKRNLDVEICQVAGVLHDIWLYCNLPLEREVHKIHDETGSRMAMEILKSSGGYTKDEMDLICKIISRHNKKDKIDGAYEEVLKDADALSHYINNSDYDKRYNYHGRIKPLMNELGISCRGSSETLTNN